jgi:predicted AlkP superfamily phosphohydrolase/phosphomutase
MIKLLLILFALLISNAVYGIPAKSTVISLSVDGFSFDYLQKHQPKNILSFAKSGVSAPLLPVYPSKIFPNHLSIITGTYPVNHGIIHSRFYHPELDEKYYLGAGKENDTCLLQHLFGQWLKIIRLNQPFIFGQNQKQKGTLHQVIIFLIIKAHQIRQGLNNLLRG